jgi:hypothetical protein
MENKIIQRSITVDVNKQSVSLNIEFNISREFLQGINCNPLDQEELFNMFQVELEKLKYESSNHR